MCNITKRLPASTLLHTIWAFYFHSQQCSIFFEKYLQSLALNNILHYCISLLKRLNFLSMLNSTNQI